MSNSRKVFFFLIKREFLLRNKRPFEEFREVLFGVIKIAHDFVSIFDRFEIILHYFRLESIELTHILAIH